MAARSAFGNAIQILEGHCGLFREALAMHMRYRHDDMINFYTEKIAGIEASLAGAYLNRGLACEALGEGEEAACSYARAVALAPADPSAYLASAGLYQKSGDYRRAVDFCTEAIKRNPLDGPAYVQRGQGYLGMEFFSLAAADFRTAARLGSSEAQEYLRAHGIKPE